MVEMTLNEPDNRLEKMFGGIPDPEADWRELGAFCPHLCRFESPPVGDYNPGPKSMGAESDGAPLRTDEGDGGGDRANLSLQSFIFQSCDEYFADELGGQTRPVRRGHGVVLNLGVS